MRALVLAGGSATRLRPLSPDLPKPLAPVANRPVLGWVLDHLDTASLTEIGVIVPAGSTGLYEQVLGARTRAGTPITWLAEPCPVGSAGALRDQRAFIGAGPVLVVPADIICPVDLRGLIAHHINHHRVDPARSVPRRRLVTVAACPRDPSVWDGDILIPHPEHTARYLFKPGPSEPGSCGPGPVASSRLGSTGTWLIEEALLGRIPPVGFADLSSQTLPALARAEIGLFDAGEVYLRDVGTPAGLLHANLETIQGRAGLPLPLPLPLPVPPPRPGTRVMAEPDAVIDDDVIIDGPVLIGSRARVRSGAHLIGPVVIGAGAALGAGCRVERALILPGATVPAHDQVIGALAGDGCAAVRALIDHAGERA